MVFPKRKTQEVPSQSSKKQRQSKSSSSSSSGSSSDSDRSSSDDEQQFEWVSPQMNAPPSPQKRLSGTGRATRLHRKETITAYNEFVLNGESYKVGDYVKLKSEAAFKKIDVYLGRIVAAWEDQPDEEDCSYFIRVCWLFTQKEVCPLDTMAKEIVASNMTHELYAGKDLRYDDVPIGSILGKIDVLLYDKFLERFPGGKLKRKDEGNIFLFRYVFDEKLSTLIEQPMPTKFLKHHGDDVPKPWEVQAAVTSNAGRLSIPKAQKKVAVMTAEESEYLVVKEKKRESKTSVDRSADVIKEKKHRSSEKSSEFVKETKRISNISEKSSDAVMENKHKTTDKSSNNIKERAGKTTRESSDFVKESKRSLKSGEGTVDAIKRGRGRPRKVDKTFEKIKIRSNSQPKTADSLIGKRSKRKASKTSGKAYVMSASDSEEEYKSSQSGGASDDDGEADESSSEESEEVESSEEEDEEDDSENDDDDVEETRSNRRRTPSKSKKTTGVPSRRTPTPRRRLEDIITPLGSRSAPMSAASTPFEYARERLHVSAVPGTLPCRDEEFAEIYSTVENAVTSNKGCCLYISGVPGTGKTATVQEVIRTLVAYKDQDKIPNFKFVELNGMRITEPTQAYSALWHAISKERVTPTHAETLLDAHFSHKQSREYLVVLMDELDLLVTKKQKVMYNFFDWPNKPHSRMIVIAVANTMDLPERMMSNKVSSRLGLKRMNFAPYTSLQLQEIIASRLAGISAFHPDAIRLASLKVGAVSGDARRALDICRRAVEILEKKVETKRKNAASVKDKAKATGDDEEEGSDVVTTKIILQAVAEMNSTPISLALSAAPFYHKFFLGVTLRVIHSSGVGVAILGDVAERFYDFCRLHNFERRGVPTLSELSTISAYWGTNRILMIDSGKEDLHQRIRLNVNEEELLSTLKQSDDKRLKMFATSH